MSDIFAGCEREYARLVAELRAGQLADAGFWQAVDRLRVEHPPGSHWRMDGASGGWLRWDGAAWQPAERPALAQPAPSVSASTPARAAADGSAPRARSRAGVWVVILAVVAVVGGAVAAVVLSSGGGDDSAAARFDGGTGHDGAAVALDDPSHGGDPADDSDDDPDDNSEPGFAPDAAVAPRSPPPEATGEVVTATLTSAGGEQSFGDLTVRVPAGAIAEDRTLTLSASTGGPPPPVAGFGLLGQFRVGLGEPDHFAEEVVLELDYRPDELGLDPTVDEAELLVVAAYYDVGVASWVGLPTEVDPARHRVLVRTRHLCDVAYWIGRGYRMVKSEGTHFEVYYHPDHAIPMPYGQGADMREFAGDIRDWFETAWQKYKAANFLVSDQVQAVVITDEVDESEWRALTGTILLARASLTSPMIAKHDAGHELFHAIQNQSYNIYSMGGAEIAGKTLVEGREWWIEGTPDFASWSVVWNRQSELPELGPFYFEESLVLNRDKVHAYQLAHFLRYLESRGVGFKELWDHVAQNAKVPSTTLTQLSIFVTRRSSGTFDAVWASYANFVLFDPKSPMSGNHFASLIATSKIARLGGKKRQAAHGFALRSNYTMLPWKVEATPDQDAKVSRVVIESAADLPMGASVELRVLAGDRRQSGGARLVKVLSGSARKSDPIEIAAGDGLYLVAMNTGATPAKVKVTARLVTEPAKAGLVGTWECTPAFADGAKVEVVIAAEQGGGFVGTLAFERELLEIECAPDGEGWLCKGKYPRSKNWETMVQILRHDQGRLRLLAPPCILYQKGIDYPDQYDDPMSQTEEILKDFEKNPGKYGVPPPK